MKHKVLTSDLTAATDICLIFQVLISVKPLWQPPDCVSILWLAELELYATLMSCKEGDVHHWLLFQSWQSNRKSLETASDSADI